MGIYRSNGYSATVEGYLVVDGRRIRLAKTNGSALTFAEPSELPPGTNGELVVIVDGQADSKLVTLPADATKEQQTVEYRVTVPF